MKQTRPFDASGIVIWQLMVWMAVFVYFSAVTVMLLAGMTVAEPLAKWGVVAILAATVAKLPLIARQFRRTGLSRFTALSYLLILLLLSTLLLGYLLR